MNLEWVVPKILIEGCGDIANLDFRVLGIKTELTGRVGAQQACDRRKTECRNPRDARDLQRLTGLGVDLIAEGPQVLAAPTKSDLEKWGPIVQKAGVKLD
jgi:hypothetical protein